MAIHSCCIIRNRRVPSGSIRLARATAVANVTQHCASKYTHPKILEPELELPIRCQAQQQAFFLRDTETAPPSHVWASMYSARWRSHDRGLADGAPRSRRILVEMRNTPNLSIEHSQRRETLDLYPPSSSRVCCHNRSTKIRLLLESMHIRRSASPIAYTRQDRLSVHFTLITVSCPALRLPHSPSRSASGQMARVLWCFLLGFRVGLLPTGAAEGSCGAEKNLALEVVNGPTRWLQVIPRARDPRSFHGL